uniref:Uncharacterized protein n=1 Tax=Oryza sativa subsp. japonica TaxID=39947 RepID=Q10RS8_ORYSJ|nr:hypothetical protein LOC_Os03g05380 [Oryza sativa Japonica Group]
MSLSWRFLNLIVGDNMPQTRSICCIDLTRQQFFQPSPPESAVAQDSTAQTPVAASTMERLQLPNPILRLWNRYFFPLSEHKILSVDKSGCSLLFDANTRHLVTMPFLNKPKRDPISLFVPNGDGDDGGSIFVMDRVPKPEIGSRAQTSDQFEAFIYRKNFVDCQLLPPPPYLRDYKHCERRHKINAYAVVDGGSQICISVEDVGTYCLDTASHTWSQVGDWTLPFDAKLEYVPELKLWFGFSAGAQHFAASDLSSMDCQSQPQLVGPWKELEPPMEWRETYDSQLVNLGSGRFCIARFFQTKREGCYDEDDVYLWQDVTALTGVEVMYELSNKDWKVIEERIEKKLSSWKDGIIIRMVIFRATHWLRFWAQLQRCEDGGEFLKVACRKLESMVMQLFANYGWRFTNRLQ